MKLSSGVLGPLRGSGGRISSLPSAGLTAVTQSVAVTPSRPLSALAQFSVYPLSSAAALAAPPPWRLLLALETHVTLPCQDFLQGVTPFTGDILVPLSETLAL